MATEFFRALWALCCLPVFAEAAMSDLRTDSQRATPTPATRIASDPLQ